MTEEFEDLTPEDKARGARVGFEALVSVCDDPKASAQAKATAGTSLMRAGGLFDKSEGGPGKEPHEMTGEELGKAIEQLEAEAAQRMKKSDVFG